MSKESTATTELDVDTENLYREETFTDLRAASVRRLTPVNPDGSPDSERETMFIGDTTLMTQVGPMPVQFGIEAETLEQAFKKFPEGVKGAIERLNERAKEMAREEASRIVVPQGGVPPGFTGGGGHGGPMPSGGGGKIMLK
ncbi:MAG: hypothetical protein GWN84_12420 [Gammaproteobacteria bacterium]|nr:hypothetical protein [Gammaproteobacteria bacterium]NIR83711.1 hypothetical protein [Gammaproteobacteria bacterium]NIR91858.1 hypothetical protein [Gammaproteobacteria bacterium]NIU04877.1 hypothetical protein [Gammaproteobacteria bacterium]NIV51859.1 hypothetical protein [Gammaproteobacteria bacterium]